MHFTVEDFRKILNWLELNGIKDTQFDRANTPLTGSETVVVVQDGRNMQLPIMDFINLIVVLAGNIAPDDEDLYTNPQGFVSFKDKAVEDINYSKGYKIIRRRAGNILLQSDFENYTIHEIRWGFNLNGATLTMPIGSEILFKSGSIRNGHIQFSTIQASPTKLLGAVGNFEDYLPGCTYSGYYIMGGVNLELVGQTVIDVLTNDIEWIAEALAEDLETGPTAEVDLEITDI